MYRLAPGPQPLPGTQLVQRVNGDGLGDYVGTPNYFATPAGSIGIRGLGCGGSCGCSDCQKTGMGLFESGLDPSGWGAGEYGVLALGAWFLYASVFTSRRTIGEHRRKIGGKISKAGKRVTGRASKR